MDACTGLNRVASLLLGVPAMPERSHASELKRRKWTQHTSIAQITLHPSWGNCVPVVCTEVNGGDIIPAVVWEVDGW